MAWHFTSRAPVYLQIVSRIRADILSGVYKADRQIPSVRQLAFEAGVNPNTMQRAFSVLEEEQLFITRGTVGRFITSDTAVLEKARETLHQETVDRLLEEAGAVGLEPEHLIEAIRARLQEHTSSQDTDDTDTTGGNSL
ncbi:MAG: GntR family transcriptional regulator [Clostridia bacterium]|nr:GntR family transcriptional regulator [Clostridia bacterium]